MSRFPHLDDVKDININNLLQITAAQTLTLGVTHVLATANTASGNYAITLPSVSAANRSMVTISAELIANDKIITIQDANDSVGWTDETLIVTDDTVTYFSNGRQWIEMDKSFETYILSASLLDISAASLAFPVVPIAGVVVSLSGAPDITVTGTAIITATSSVGAIADTLSLTGTAGDVVTQAVAPAANAVVAAGTTLKLLSNAGSTNVSRAIIQILIRKTNG